MADNEEGSLASSLCKYQRIYHKLKFSIYGVLRIFPASSLKAKFKSKKVLYCSLKYQCRLKFMISWYRPTFTAIIPKMIYRISEECHEREEKGMHACMIVIAPCPI